MLSSLSLVATSAASLVSTSRRFVPVPYGSTYEAVSACPLISCDGKVAYSGAVKLLELSHWTDNATPDELYADTSTECALKLHTARQAGRYSEFDDAVVLNNHFDSDGVLSVFACIHPEEASAHSTLLAAGAAAGDFGEWPSDAGVKLDAAIEAIGEGAATDAEAYEEALVKLPWLLDDLSSRGGSESIQLWSEGWQSTTESWAAFTAGDASVSSSGGARLEPPVDVHDESSRCALRIQASPCWSNRWASASRHRRCTAPSLS